MSARKRWSLASILASVAVVASGLAVAPATAAIVTHGSLVPEEAAGGYPIILKTPLYVPDGTPIYNNPQPRETRAVTLAGRNIVSGGDFWEIELKDGSVISQQYFAAWNIDSKQMVCQQKFVFDKNITAVEPGPTPNQVYVAGRFGKVTGANGLVKSRTRLALLDLSTCSVVDAFKSPNPNGVPREILYQNGRLFIGGDFTKLGTNVIETIAELNPATGAPVQAFKFATSGELTSRVHALEMDAAGNRLYVGGRFGTMTGPGGTAYNPMAIINISNPAAPTLTTHRLIGMTNTQGQSLAIADLQDVALSPERTHYALAYGTATVSDYIYYAATTESTINYTWRHYQRDSSFGVAVTDQAVYATGHFCKPDGGPGSSLVMEPKLGLDTCTGTQISGGVYRSHIDALSRTDGTPLNWNPGQGSFTGGTVIEPIKRGLLIGYDGEWTGGVRTGTTAFLDFGAGVEDQFAPSDVVFTAPTAGGSLDNPATLTGKATDDLGVVEYRLRIKSGNDYLQPDGTISPTYYAFKSVPLADGSFSLSVPLPAGSYSVEAWAVDAADHVSATNTVINFTGTGLDKVAPVTTLDLPKTASPEATVVVGGVTTDLTAVSDIKLRVTNSAGQYLQASGTFASTLANLAYTVNQGALGSASVTWSRDLGTLPVDTYTVTARGTDSAGNVKSYLSTFKVVVSPPTVSITGPAATIQTTADFAIAGTAADNAQVGAVAVRVTNAAGLFLQGDGTFAAGSFDLAATVTGLGTPSATFAYNAGRLPTGNYTVTVVVTDGVGQTATATTAVSVKSEPVPAITSYSPGGSTTGGYTVGYRFTVNSPTVVTALGFYDYNRNGRNDNNRDTQVAIYRTDTRAQVALATVPAAATATSGWFYKDLAASVTLQPGVTYTVVYQTWLFGEYLGLGGSVAKDSRMTITGYAYSDGSTMTYPVYQSNTDMYGVPNMKVLAP
ncbi:MAG: DUF4082 domain-containing protein [Nocardioides sp.]